MNTNIITIKLNNKDIRVFARTSADAEYLGTVESAICTCAHHLTDHTEPEQQEQCLIGGCRCTYFSPHKVKKPKPRVWRGSW